MGDQAFFLDLFISGNLNGGKIPPLVLYSFVENCFKHGVRKCAGESWVSIKIELKGDHLIFNTRNNITRYIGKAEEQVQSPDCCGGLGMVAAKELLENKCSGRFTLDTGIQDDVFFVDLKMETIH